MGLPLVEGYGLTEAAPVVTAATLEDSELGTVGRPLHGVEIRLGQEDELLVRSPAVMSGYWGDAGATQRAIDADGWLKTGDIAEFRDGRVAIRGRLKEILALSTGEKVIPTVVESSLLGDPLFEQVCVIGEGRPSLIVIIVLSKRHWMALADRLQVDPRDPNATEAAAAILRRTEELLKDLPAFSRLRAAHFVLTPWTVQDGILTPTLKVKRRVIEERFKQEIEALYERIKAIRIPTASTDRG